jgi:hypothetical protein
MIKLNQGDGMPMGRGNGDRRLPDADGAERFNEAHPDTWPGAGQTSS